MLPLFDRPVVFRAEVLAEGVEDRLQRRGGPGGQVPGQPPDAVQRGAQAQVPVPEPVLVPGVIVAVVGVGMLRLPRLVDRPRQHRQVFQRQPVRGRVQQNRIGLVPLAGGELVGPGGDVLGPGVGDGPGGHRGRDPAVAAQPPVPADRRARRRLGHLVPVHQPGPRRPVPVRLIAGLGGERGQHRGVDRGQLRLRPLQARQHLPVRRRTQRRPVGRGQVIQRRVQHPGGIGRAGECCVRHVDHLPPGAHGDFDITRSYNNLHRISNRST